MRTPPRTIGLLQLAMALAMSAAAAGTAVQDVRPGFYTVGSFSGSSMGDDAAIWKATRSRMRPRAVSQRYSGLSKGREDVGMTVEPFFAQYATLSMGEDERALAAVYAPSFFVGGPKGTMTFANDAQFLDWLVRVRAFNRQHGMLAVSPAAVRETILSPIHVLAEVRWEARFEKTGAQAIEFDIAYLLERVEDSWRVLGYISARDQEEEMRALGLL